MGKPFRCKLGIHNWEKNLARQKTCKDCGKESTLPSSFQYSRDSDGKSTSWKSGGSFEDGGDSGGE